MKRYDKKLLNILENDYLSWYIPYDNYGKSKSIHMKL